MVTRFLKYSVLALSVSTVLSGCGGSSDNDGGNSNNPQPPTTVKGRAIDGPLAGATVLFKNCDNKTTTTDTSGYFNFPENCLQSEIVITGGVDTATDLPFSGELKAPSKAAVAGQENTVIVSPITTLIATAPSENAKNALISALGLSGKDLLAIDPMQDKEVYAKTVAVQQIIETIQETVASLGGSTSESNLNQAAISALTTALTSSNTANLTSPETIKEAIVTTVTAVKDDLPQTLKDNVANVATNLGTLTAVIISENVKTVEDKITALPATAFNGTVTTIKAETKEVVAAAKESVTVEKLVTTLAPALVATPADIATSLDVIAKQVAATPANTAVDLTSSEIVNAITTIEEKANVDINTDQLGNVTSFYSDYLQLSGFSVQNTPYTITQLNGSIAQPISVNNLNNLLLNVKAVGSHKSSNINVGAALDLTTEGKKLTISTPALNLTFDAAGTLTAASIPANTNVKVTSTLASVANATFTTSTPVNALSNGQIALNASTLGNLSASLASQLTSLESNLKGKTVTTTAILSGSPHIAISDKALATTYTVDTVAGSGVTAKFNVQ